MIFPIALTIKDFPYFIHDLCNWKIIVKLFLFSILYRLDIVMWMWIYFIDYRKMWNHLTDFPFNNKSESFLPPCHTIKFETDLRMLNVMNASKRIVLSGTTKKIYEWIERLQSENNFNWKNNQRTFVST